MTDKKLLLKKIRSLSKEEKDFINLMNNYALSLCLGKKQREINELCEIIKIQNERGQPK